MIPELKPRIAKAIELLINRLDPKDNLISNNKDKFSLKTVLLEMTFHIPEFNFYPSDIYGRCCQVAFFTSLTGRRWRLDKKERLYFEEMYKNLIKHCQGSCQGTTKVAVIVADNWDDDIAEFWQPNINQLKMNGVVVLVNLIIGSNQSSYEL